MVTALRKIVTMMDQLKAAVYFTNGGKGDRRKESKWLSEFMME